VNLELMANIENSSNGVTSCEGSSFDVEVLKGTFLCSEGLRRSTQSSQKSTYLCFLEQYVSASAITVETPNNITLHCIRPRNAFYVSQEREDECK
jgi:hypothetical protein